MPATVAVLQGYALLRSLLGDTLSRSGFTVSVHEDASTFLEFAEGRQPESAVVDLGAVMDGPGLIGLLRMSAPQTRIVVLAWDAVAVPVEALTSRGVRRLIDARNETLASLVEALREDATTSRFPADAFFQPTPAKAVNRVPLSPREREVLGCLTAGHDNLKIAAELGICERTVKAHVTSLYRKLQVENRSQLVLRGLELGLSASLQITQVRPSSGERSRETLNPMAGPGASDGRAFGAERT